MSKDFFMSRSYLSKRFKAESNVTLTDFILTKKTDEVYIGRDINIVFICFLNTESTPRFLR